MKKENKENVSMPYFGLLSFLQTLTFYQSTFMQLSFNALLRASFFSTEKITDEKKQELMFQCPTSGFFLFYDRRERTAGVEKLTFQCPTSGFFLFYAMLLQPLILLAFQPPVCK